MYIARSKSSQAAMQIESSVSRSPLPELQRWVDVLHRQLLEVWPAVVVDSPAGQRQLVHLRARST